LKDSKLKILILSSC